MSFTPTLVSSTISLTDSNCYSIFGPISMDGNNVICPNSISGYSSNKGERFNVSTSVININNFQIYWSALVGTNAIAVSYSTNGLWYSTNSGQTWIQSNITTGTFVSCAMVDANAIAGSLSNTGLWYSTNSGVTWIQSTSVTPGVVITSNSFRYVFMVGTNAIAGSNVGSNIGLWYSANSGQTWTQSNKTSSGFRGLYMLSDGKALAMDYVGGIWYSTDNGVTWRISLNATNSIFYTSAMVGQNAIAGTATSNTGLWYSSDSGVTWTQSNITTGNFAYVYMVGANAIAAPFSYTGLLYSTNSGQTWTQSNLATAWTAGSQKFSMVGTNAVISLLNTRGYIQCWYSSNSGQSWSPSQVNYPIIYSIYIINKKAIAGTSNGILYSSDNGVTWTQSTSVTTDTFCSVYMVGANAIAASYSNTGLWYSSDSGVTWTQSASVTTGDFYSVYMVGTNAIAASTGLWYSSDSGVTWTQSASVTTGDFYSVYMVGTHAIAASTGLWYSSDSGVTWTQSTSALTSLFTSVYMVGTHAIAASNSTNGLWYSSDSGVTWTQSASALTSSFNSVYMVGTHAIAASNGLWYSSDSGVTWVQSNKTSGTFLSLYMLGTNAVAGGNNNIGLWYSSDSGQTWIQSNVSTNSFTTVAMTRTIDVIAGSTNGIFYYTNIVCFKEGTKILTDKGYVLIEDLRPGDFVKTLLDGYKPIALIGNRTMAHVAKENRIKDQLYQCSPSEYPEVFEPLVITGCHSILVENSTTVVNTDQIEKVKEVNGGIYLTDGKLRLPACVDERASVYAIAGTYTIYHLALENDDYYMNYGIYANGLLVETCSKRYLTELSNMDLIE